MKSAQRERAVELRLKHQLGYHAIAKEVGVAKSTLSRWLEDLPLSDKRILELRREAWSRGEGKRERFRQTMRAKRDARDLQIYELQKKKFTNISSQAMFIAGLMLYVAEGDKKTRAEIAFANTDHVMILFFARWLDTFLGIEPSRLRIQLHLYENMDIAKEEAFWKRELGMKKSQLCKSQIRPVRIGKYSYREPFRHGTCKLYVGGVLKKTELMLSIKAFFDTYSGHLHA
jgi:transcriptional regulator with XRE-family HTH domain